MLQLFSVLYAKGSPYVLGDLPKYLNEMIRCLGITSKNSVKWRSGVVGGEFRLNKMSFV